MNEEPQGPGASPASGYLLGFVVVALAFIVGWSHPAWWVVPIWAASFGFSVVFTIKGTWHAGRTAELGQTLKAYQEAAQAMEYAAAKVAELEPALLHLTGGGPMDGTTVPHPTSFPDGQHSQVVVTDPDTEEVLGAYVQDEDDPHTLIWRAGDPDEDA